MTLPRAALLVLVVSFGAYANAIGNGFAYDDVQIVETNPVVTTPLLSQALLGPYWPRAQPGSGLYRPVVLTSFALEWWAFNGSPVGFHLVNVIGHAAVSLLVLIVLAGTVPIVSALVGALLFAVHPVHVEAVANVVGRAEIYAAGAVLLACHIYLAGREWGPGLHGLRIATIALLYLIGLGSKEIAVSLPAALVLLEAFAPSAVPVRQRLRMELPLFVALAAVLLGYLAVRSGVLGTMTGEVAAPALLTLGGAERVWTAFGMWPQYLRLLFFPLDLVADYSPAVISTASGLTMDALAGVGILVGLLALAWRTRASAPLVAAGILWFCITILPVSNVLIPAGIILAERTLYLPSVGLSMSVAGVVVLIGGRHLRRDWRPALGLGLLVGSLLMVRTVLRNPSWLDTYTVLNTLAVEHPESYLSLRVRGLGLASAGDFEGASQSYEAAVALAPAHYGLLVEVAEFYGSRGGYERAGELLAEAIPLSPDQPGAYRLLSEYLIRQGRGRESHAVAVAGLRYAGPQRELFALLSESYIANGDLDAAVRARTAALGQAPDSSQDWGRLAELYDAMGRTTEADGARVRQAALAQN